MLHRLNQHLPQAGVRALILSPTRDLALRTLKFKKIGHFTVQSPNIILAVPGRLMHRSSEVDDMTLRSVEYVVFDKADCLLGMGFAVQLHKILAQLDPQLVRLDFETKISPDLKVALFTLRQEEKYAALPYLIREHIGSDQRTLICVSTKHHVEFLNILFREEGSQASTLLGALTFHYLIMLSIGTFLPSLKYLSIELERLQGLAEQVLHIPLTFEDMAYLLDLHLFLSKEIKAAPTGEEVFQDMDGIMSRNDRAMATGETIYGRFPQKVVDLVSDRVREIINTCAY
ncbi:hypothetical protein VNO77_08877 [Canavalia gladiata]|uniref:DEAD/DEAH-box helicase domain-containing protein n=1 Tax=Canavalia gladiata TaxID=3824 RepID=A0AAN9MAC4_CANGL